MPATSAGMTGKLIGVAKIEGRAAIREEAEG
jgi:hypothetical protein